MKDLKSKDHESYIDSDSDVDSDSDYESDNTYYNTEINKGSQITRQKALKILNINETNDEEIIKKAYRTMALKYHPDKNKSENANEQFILIHEAYNFLKSSREPEKSDYYTVLQNFMRSIFAGDLNNMVIFEIVRKIMNVCEEKSLDLLMKIDKHLLKTVYEMMLKYKEVLHLSVDFLEKIQGIVKIKYDNDERIIMHPLLDDLFENNVYKLTIEGESYIVPLWHHHLVYDSQKMGADGNQIEIYVDCYPILPDDVYIDEYNNIHITIEFSIIDVWAMDSIEFSLGSRVFSCRRDLLTMCNYQKKLFIGQGIPVVNTNDMYDVLKKSDIVLHFFIV